MRKSFLVLWRLGLLAVASRSRFMVQIFQIHHSRDAPRLQLLNERNAGLLHFNGERRGAKWPRGGLELKDIDLPQSLFQFYRLASGVLVYREALIEACDDFYWVATQNIAPLQAVAGSIVFNLINIIDFMEPLRPGEIGYETGAPFKVASFYAPIIKIKGRPPTDMYCASGLTNPMNEFKAVYDHYGFRGLTFQTCWTEGTFT